MENDYPTRACVELLGSLQRERKSTPEDIFKVIATPLGAQQSYLSYDYFAKKVGGTYLLRPTDDIMTAYDSSFNNETDDPSAYNPSDLRGKYNILFAGSQQYGAKYRSITGTENFPVLRLGEIILIRAEALARTGHVPEAISELNLIRARAGESAFVSGTNSAQQVVNAIVAERRLEMAFEGDRWHDLNRLGLTPSVMGIDPTQELYPIPQSEINVAPGLTQNPGY